MKNIVIITGASSGIGMEFALQLDSHFRKTDEFWLIARDRRKLQFLSKRLRNNCKILSMDLTQDGQIERLKDTLKDEKCRIRVLVNCAGFGVMGDAMEIDEIEQAEMIRLNCEALTRVTTCCLPYMARKGCIIQLASSASFFPQPGFAVYAASKAYVDSYSLAIREELRSREITVTSVCPGPVDTPFFTIAEKHGKRLSIKDACLVSPYEVVEKALRDALQFKKARSVYSLPILSLYWLSKLLPKELLAYIVNRMKEEA